MFPNKNKSKFSFRDRVFFLIDIFTVNMFISFIRNSNTCLTNIMHTVTNVFENNKYIVLNYFLQKRFEFLAIISIEKLLKSHTLAISPSLNKSNSYWIHFIILDNVTHNISFIV